MRSLLSARSAWRWLAGALLAALATAAPAQNERPIRVGAVSALGVQAGFPESSQAARRYFDAVNAAGGVNGRRIEYVSLDEGPSPQTAAGAARKLIADPEVVALVGGSGLFDCPVNAAAYAAAGLVSLQGASVAPECFASSHIVPMNNGPYLGLENADRLRGRTPEARAGLSCRSWTCRAWPAGYQRALETAQAVAEGRAGRRGLLAPRCRLRRRHPRAPGAALRCHCLHRSRAHGAALARRRRRSRAWARPTGFF